MPRRRWAVIGSVLVLALVIFGAALAPRLRGSSHVQESAEIVMPRHWWKSDLDEQQLSTLQALWGSDTTIEEFVCALWPGVIREVPIEMVDAWKEKGVYWPAESYEDWRSSAFQTMCFGLVVPGNEQAAKCFDVYLGDRAAEETTLRRSTDLGLVEDSCYRISMYIDPVTR